MFYKVFTRILDIIISIFAIIIFSPLMIFVAIAIKLESKGPIFADVPHRVGLHYRPFRFYKFRSMIVNAHNIIREDPKYKKLYDEYRNNNYKLESDPRVTGVGRFIRKYSIDEIPQFFNVFLGDMSLVGPRAYYFDELEFYIKSNPAYKNDIVEITNIKPGITGVWQISGRSKISFDKRIAIDLEYSRSKSIRKNLIILFKTPFAVLSKKGAY